MSEEEIKVFPTACWAVWSTHCFVMMESKFIAPATTCSYAMKSWKDAREAGDNNAKTSTKMLNSHPMAWSLTNTGWTKCIVDTGVVNEVGVGVGVSVVCRDGGGEV